MPGTVGPSEESPEEETHALETKERRALRRKTRTATLGAIRALGGEAQREEIHDWALAHADFSRRELVAAPPEVAATRYSSLVEHDLSWALTNLKRDGLVENPKWGLWRLTGAAQPADEVVADRPSNQRLATLRAMPYRQYLRTPEWRRTRAAALVRSGNACALDVAHTGHLEVHHRTYQRLGAELATDVIVLCHACHSLHHETYGLPHRAAREADPGKPSLPQRLLRRLFGR